MGLLGHGTVGRAFAELLEERAGAIESEVGRRPEISGVLTRSRGDFDDILERSDLVVELMGGIDPTRGSFSSTSRTRMSPDSQCMPAMVESSPPPNRSAISAS